MIVLLYSLWGTVTILCLRSQSPPSVLTVERARSDGADEQKGSAYRSKSDASDAGLMIEAPLPGAKNRSTAD